MSKKLFLLLAASVFITVSALSQSNTLTYSPWATLDLNTLDKDWTFSVTSFLANSTNTFPMVNNANAVMTLNMYPGGYYHQLGFNASGEIYERYNGGTWYKMFSERNLNNSTANFSAKNLTTYGIFQTINKDSPGASWDNISLWSDGENSYIYSNGDEKGLHIKSNQANKIIFESNVGIGYANPTNALDVNGTIHAHEVKVDLTGWSDFVFAPSYKLKPLSEVELYIKANGKLPEIPSASEVEQNGVNVGDMQAKLLQKVEELTLYSIEQDKAKLEQDQKYAELKQQLDVQSKEIEYLKQLITKIQN